VKDLLRIFLVVGLIVTFSVWAAAQSVGASDKEAEVTSTYDAAKNETKIELRRVQVISDKNKDAYVSMSATFEGQKLAAEPEDVVFIISALSTGDYKYPAINRMKVVAEKSKLSDIVMLNLDKRKLNDDFLETLGTRIKIGVFKQLAGFNSVKLQFGDTTFEIGEEQMSKIRSFQSKITL
jgi:hypothetical protein